MIPFRDGSPRNSVRIWKKKKKVKNWHSWDR